MDNGLIYKFAKKCEKPGKSLIWNTCNYFFRVLLIVLGRVIYNKICSEYPSKHIIVQPARSIGDGLHFGYFKSYLYNYLNIKEEDCILIIPDNTTMVYKALGIKHYVPLKMWQVVALNAFCSFYESSKHNSTNVGRWMFFDYQMSCNQKLKPDYHCISKSANIQEIKQSFSSIKCEIGRTVVLSPYEKSVTVQKEKRLDSDFWYKLAEELKRRGYNVCTNCKGDVDEPPIPGTCAFYPSLANAEKAIELAGTCVAVRSGFVDFIGNTAGTLIILYPSEGFLNAYKIPILTDNHYEYVYDNLSDADLMEKVIGMVKPII